ncbi:CCHC-type domain-containing protein [Nephila pilipes]|uniref:CCHC-type domain-containing protein n=1 Tax=Nephila pilipes TaxID=299642 RepID=A0A8X6PB51_NEPPI|nr:CCHC-type domain-containing protein [Nephila pilipes]
MADSSNTELLALLTEVKKSMEAGQEEMRIGQEELKKRMEKGQDEMRVHVETQVEGIKEHVNTCIEKIEDDQSVKREINETDSQTLDEQTSWSVFKTQFDVVSSSNGWTDRVKASQLVATLQGTELKTRRQKPGESLQVLAADVERLMSLAYAECPLDIRESLAAQYFVDAIRDKIRNTQRG